MQIEITESAKEKINEILSEENNANACLRTFVQGGGCSGFSYGFTIEEEMNEDDFVLETGKFRVLIDSMSYQYLVGSTIDYKDELMGASFTIKNPQATSTCGCGSSFSV